MRYSGPLLGGVLNYKLFDAVRGALMYGPEVDQIPKPSTKQEILFFDQLRDQLDEERSVQENLAELGVAQVDLALLHAPALESRCCLNRRGGSSRSGPSSFMRCSRLSGFTGGLLVSSSSSTTPKAKVSLPAARDIAKVRGGVRTGRGVG